MARDKGSQSFWMITSVLVLSTVLAQDSRQFLSYHFEKLDLFVDGIATIEDGRLKITNSSEKAIGHAFISTPISFINTFLSFSTEFVFAIIPEESGTKNYDQCMFFLVSPTNDLRYGAARSYLGIFNKKNDNRTDNHIFAVEFDTNENHEALDKSDNHVGIDINSIVSVKYENTSYFDDTTKMNRTLFLGSIERIHAWIEYDGDQRWLNVTLAPFGTPKPSSPLLSIPIDLSKIFKEQMYFDFSGSTSLLKSHQYIMGWSLSISGKAQSLDIAKVLDLPPHQPPHSSYALTQGQVIIISIISAIVFLLIPSGMMYLYFKKKYAEEFEQWEHEYSPQRFSFRTLYRATICFKENHVLGVGGFEKVYRGDLRDGTQMGTLLSSELQNL